MHSGLDPSFHSNYHHPIVSLKFNLKIYYLPPYEKLVKHYKHTNTDLIKCTITFFDLEKAFSDLGI